MRSRRHAVTGDALVALLGHSLRAKALRDAMTALGIDTPKDNFDNAGNRYDMVTRGGKRGASLTFLGYRRYRREYGEAPSVVDETKDELVLVELDLSAMLPFGLARGESATSVVDMVGRKPFEKSLDVSYGQAWWFRFDEYK